MKWSIYYQEMFKKLKKFLIIKLFKYILYSIPNYFSGYAYRVAL